MSSRAILAASILLLASLITVFWIDARPINFPIALIPTLSGEVEYCQTCHADLPEISSSHPVDAFGCVICHGGERLALDADLAHSSMRGGRNPSDFSVVEASCGGSDCHSGAPAEGRDHIHRVLTSIQTTYAGAITQIRFTYGAQSDLVAQQGINAIEDDQITTPTGLQALEEFVPEVESSSSVLAFAGNCLNCHLSAEPLEGSPYARLTGCAACHTPTANADLEGPLHRLTTAIPYTQCNTCHNRGNYDLREMQFRPRSDQPLDRLHDYYQPIAQFVRCEWTLDCVDCHTRVEAMGDGDLHSSKLEIQYVQCQTCHGTLAELPLTMMIGESVDESALAGQGSLESSASDLALRMAFLNPVIDLEEGDTILVTEQGEPLWNTRLLPDGTYELFGKATGQRLTFRPVMGTACQQKLDQQESRYCHECHAVER